MRFIVSLWKLMFPWGFASIASFYLSIETPNPFAAVGWMYLVFVFFIFALYNLRKFIKKD